MMSGRWKPNNQYGYSLYEGDCRAHIFPTKEAKHDVIVAHVQTPLFPPMSRSTFTSMQTASEWCEQWLGFASELLQLRETVKIKQEQAQKDFQEIMQLREELHGYKYPKANRREAV